MYIVAVDVYLTWGMKWCSACEIVFCVQSWSRLWTMMFMLMTVKVIMEVLVTVVVAVSIYTGRSSFHSLYPTETYPCPIFFHSLILFYSFFNFISPWHKPQCTHTERRKREKKQHTTVNIKTKRKAWNTRTKSLKWYGELISVVIHRSMQWNYLCSRNLGKPLDHCNLMSNRCQLKLS